jgi:hypothetical protein
VPAMPANTVDLIGFFSFLFQCAADERFNAETLLLAMKEAGIDGPLDGPVYRFIVPRMKSALQARAGRVQFLFDPSRARVGPGRVDTFDSFKYEQFAYFYKLHNEAISPDEIYGVVDFPSVWNQAKREGLNLHWDGNNTSVRERNFSAAIGAGGEPPTIDIDRLFRTERWLATLPPPAYPFAIDSALAERGEPIYRQRCYRCHDFGGDKVGQVFPLAAIGTDRSRLDSYTPFLLEAQKDYTKGFFWSFRHFRKTDGYASHPLDGVWARAPYLHNGSVPTMWDLLTPEAARPKTFAVGGDIYDQKNMGFVHDASSGMQVFDTSMRGNSNRGHTGPVYGTDLGDDEKRALIEYLKTYDGTDHGAPGAREPSSK